MIHNSDPLFPHPHTDARRGQLSLFAVPPRRPRQRRRAASHFHSGNRMMLPLAILSVGLAGQCTTSADCAGKNMTVPTCVNQTGGGWTQCVDCEATAFEYACGTGGPAFSNQPSRRVASSARDSRPRTSRVRATSSARPQTSMRHPVGRQLCAVHHVRQHSVQRDCVDWDQKKFLPRAEAKCQEECTDRVVSPATQTMIARRSQVLRPVSSSPTDTMPSALLATPPSSNVIASTGTSPSFCLPRRRSARRRATACGGRALAARRDELEGSCAAAPPVDGYESSCNLRPPTPHTPSPTTESGGGGGSVRMCSIVT